MKTNIVYNDTYELSEYDRCISCGQQVKYLDIKQLREQDWLKKQ